MRLIHFTRLSRKSILLYFFAILFLTCLNHISNAQELHTVQGDARVEKRLNVGVLPYLNDNISIRGTGGFASSSGLSLTHRQSFNLGQFPITNYAEGRIFNNGQNLSLQYGLDGTGSKFSLSATSHVSFANNKFYRKVSGSELRMAFEWGVEFSQLENGWGANSDRPWLKQGWRGDNSIDVNGASGDFIYIGSSGNRDNNNQFAMMLSQGGIAIGRGNNDGNKLNDVLIKFKNLGGKGRVITDELEIRGGADLAENFDVINANKGEIKPGHIVSISDVVDGKLELCKRPFDRKVIGIVSGANGVGTGMYMGQDGTLAQGDYPIALTGRVYVKANEENGIIQLGDFLTSSSRTGEAMRVSDITKAHGAIIGKAMTTIDENGFVLVLVNLQ